MPQPFWEIEADAKTAFKRKNAEIIFIFHVLLCRKLPFCAFEENVRSLLLFTFFCGGMEVIFLSVLASACT